jgi:hypothetical protein
VAGLALAMIAAVTFAGVAIPLLRGGPPAGSSVADRRVGRSVFLVIYDLANTIVAWLVLAGVIVPDGL